MLMERVATLTDRDIDFAEKIFRRDGDLIALRGDGERAAMPEEFKVMTKSFREQCRKRDKAARDAIRLVIEEEVEERFTLFSEATPDQFGRAKEEGVTPLQALLIAYSVVGDDYLDGSQEDLQKDAPELAKRKGKKAYGVNGYRFSTPINIVFDRRTTSGLLDRIEKGRNWQ